ncbi:hypothetical protein TI04_02965 [Achromatium sp. WMS2]|nr:hypothetical protein TI04_02965 [Achromatium sp. WMS2]
MSNLHDTDFYPWTQHQDSLTQAIDIYEARKFYHIWHIFFIFTIVLYSLPIQVNAIQRSFLNTSFEIGPTIIGPDWCFTAQSTVPPWLSSDSSTNPNNQCTVPSAKPIMELWANNFQGVPARDGSVHAELNPNAFGTLSQKICILQNEEISWYLSHRGRIDGTTSPYYDRMRFYIGDVTTGLVLDATTRKNGITQINSCHSGSSLITVTNCTKKTTNTWGDYGGKFKWTGASGDLLVSFAAVETGSHNATNGNFLDAIHFYLKPVVEFSASGGASLESVVSPTAPVLRVIGQLDAPMVISLKITGGTAILGEDYTTPTGNTTFTVTIPSGNYSYTDTFATGIAIINDNIKEGDETIIIEVNADPGNPYVVSSSGTCNSPPNQAATYTITDDDTDLHLIKNTVSGVGNFNFTLTNADTDLTTPISETTATITIAAAGVDTEFDSDANANGIQAIKVSKVDTEIKISESIPTGWIVSGSCNVVGGTNPTVVPIPINQDGTVTIPAANVTLGSSTTCTYINTSLLDYSDAPASYGSPSHQKPTTPTVYLGTTAPDGDTVANQTAWQGQSTANGDDNTDTGDEGIAQLLNSGNASFPTFSTGNSSYSLVLKCAGNGAVSGWIDFNRNGTFDNSDGELAQSTCSSGQVTLTWSGFATTIKVGPSYARFRTATSAAEIATATGAASDGEVEDYTFNIRPGIKIIKTLSPASDSGQFNLTITGGNPAAPTGSNNPANDVINNGTTGFVAIDAGASITVQETAGTSTNLSNYSTTLDCYQGDGITPITPAPTTSLTGTTRTGEFSSPANDTIGNAAQIICIFTNNKLPTIKIQKTTISGTGGPFSFDTVTNLDNTPAAITTTTANTPTPESPTPIRVTKIDTAVTIAETSIPTGYSLTAVACTDANSTVTGNTGTFGNLTPTNTLTILNTNMVAGADINCIFTNTYASKTLQLQKTWNDAQAADAVTITAKIGGTTIASLNSTATGQVNQTDANTATTVATDNIIELDEFFTNGQQEKYRKSLECTGTNGLIGNTLTVGATDTTIVCTITNQFDNSIITGNVFEDSGIGGGISGVTGNDGIRNGTEAGIKDATVKLTNCSDTIYHSTTTNSNGDYSLNAYLAPVGTVCVEETNAPAFTLSPSNNVGTTNGTIINPDKIQFTLNANNNYSGVNFGDLMPNEFVANHSKYGVAGSTVQYSHTFIAYGGGSVTFSTSGTSTPANPNWTETLYRDTNCNDTLDAGDINISGVPIPWNVDTNGGVICLILSQFIPIDAKAGVGKTKGDENLVTIQASYDYTGTSPLINAVLTVTDTTRSSMDDTGFKLFKEVDKTTAKPGEVLVYTITYSNTGRYPVSDIVIYDAVPEYTTLEQICCVTSKACLNTVRALPLFITKCTPTYTNTDVKWTLQGSLTPGASGKVKYSVKIND